MSTVFCKIPATAKILRFIDLPNAIAANVCQMLYGMLLVLCMMYRPLGIFGEYAFYVHTGKRKKERMPGSLRASTHINILTSSIERDIV